MGDCRRVGVAVDFSPYSTKALKWAIDNIIRSGDHLILITVRNGADYESGEMQLWETTGSPLIPLTEFSDPQTMKKYEVTPDPEVIQIATATKQKGITVVMKIFWGDPREKLCEAVERTPLDSLIIGNRGHGTLKRAIMGSVSNYVMNHAPCPVTVVKCNDKV